MPLRNRVTPYGAIIAVADRGLFMGNRGIIHDPTTRTIRRAWASKRWLVCLCDFKARKRNLMFPGSWTELFFLDEATALAAGHRPCFECRRAEAKAFQTAWALGNGGDLPSAKAMDAVLHDERLSGRAKRLHAADRPLSKMPDGTMVGVEQDSFVVVAGNARRWTPAGYEPSRAASACMAVLTPPSTLRALQAGYQPCLHPSALAI
jgi:hypothetical protein